MPPLYSALLACEDKILTGLLKKARQKGLFKMGSLTAFQRPTVVV